MSAVDRIRDAAVAAIADDALEAATVRAVAARAGLSIGAVQHHFPTKNELLIGAFERSVERLLARVGELGPTSSSLEGVHIVLRELLPSDAASAAEARVWLAFAARAPYAIQIQEVYGAALAALRSAVSEAFAAAGVHAPEREAATVVALVDGLTVHALADPGGMPTPRAAVLLDAHLDALVRTSTVTTSAGAGQGSSR